MRCFRWSSFGTTGLRALLHLSLLHFRAPGSPRRLAYAEAGRRCHGYNNGYAGHLTHTASHIGEWTVRHVDENQHRRPWGRHVAKSFLKTPFSPSAQGLAEALN